MPPSPPPPSCPPCRPCTHDQRHLQAERCGEGKASQRESAGWWWVQSRELGGRRQRGGFWMKGCVRWLPGGQGTEAGRQQTGEQRRQGRGVQGVVSSQGGKRENKGGGARQRGTAGRGGTWAAMRCTERGGSREKLQKPAAVRRPAAAAGSAPRPAHGAMDAVLADESTKTGKPISWGTEGGWLLSVGHALGGGWPWAGDGEGSTGKVLQVGYCW